MCEPAGTCEVALFAGARLSLDQRRITQLFETMKQVKAAVCADTGSALTEAQQFMLLEAEACFADIATSFHVLPGNAGHVVLFCKCCVMFFTSFNGCSFSSYGTALSHSNQVLELQHLRWPYEFRRKLLCEQRRPGDNGLTLILPSPHKLCMYAFNHAILCLHSCS